MVRNEKKLAFKIHRKESAWSKLLKIGQLKNKHVLLYEIYSIHKFAVIVCKVTKTAF